MSLTPQRQSFPRDRWFRLSDLRLTPLQPRSNKVTKGESIFHTEKIAVAANTLIIDVASASNFSTRR